MEYGELLASVKEELRARVEPEMEQASTKAFRDFLGVQERLGPADRQAVIDGTACLLEHAVDRAITDIMVLGHNDNFDAAVADLIEMNSALGGIWGQTHEDAIQSMAHELKLCSNAFAPEIALFARMHRLAKSGLSHEEVLSQILAGQ
jgi:hypothetical protein